MAKLGVTYSVSHCAESSTLRTGRWVSEPLSSFAAIVECSSVLWQGIGSFVPWV